MAKHESTPGFPSPEAAEAAFYFAFAACDLGAMNDVWATDGVVCIHPGSDALLGREMVMQSWGDILLNSELPSLRTEVLSRTVRNDLAVHVVEESIAPGGKSSDVISIVLATNVYRRDENGWKIVEHHASAPMARHRLTQPEARRHTVQ
jgi:ketosteroid isomerase-like protein